MQTMNRANAYNQAATRRSWRQQEADVFHRATGALRVAMDDSGLARIRALADNRRLWSMVIDLMRDPENALPAPLRASIVSVGMTVLQEMARPEPDLSFLIGINDNIAAGLSGDP
jgi:flagellar biosynthesis regulator FlaF